MQAPAWIGGLYVVAFATVDESIPFVQRYTLNVDGEWLGRVPCLAICRYFESETYFVQCCDIDWDPLGVAAEFTSVDKAKTWAERGYPGIGARWIDNDVDLDTAHAHYNADLEASACSFCRRTRLEVTSMAGRGPRICKVCVDAFHEAMHSDKWES